VENQIFFREFKDQMERYLNIHREIWEEIDLIKDVQSIKGKNIGVLRQKIDGYQKTIRLIESRINQMSSYVDARSSITRSIGIEDSLSELFQYKFQTLSSTHGYIKEIWRMTNDYLNSAYQVLSTLESESTKESITSLRLITTYGVIAGIISYLSRDSWPEVTTIGIIYFILLIVATWLINKIITIISTNSSYKLKFNKDNL
jgi:hypothetical protein